MGKIIYKSISIFDHETPGTLEFSLTANKISKDKEMIIKFVDFLEFIGHVKPRYVIINCTDCEYRMSENLFDYFRNIIVNQLIDHPIQKVFIVSERVKEIAWKLASPAIKLHYCHELNEVFQKMDAPQPVGG
jgi:hypothetical protein